ncbi:MAG TPA: hypothetical protein ENI60_07135 [Candidatus Fraserbacteria bacterium]|nr:hypothetical protein [Candidatus Fraserbacteria bacterium]
MSKAIATVAAIDRQAVRGQPALIPASWLTWLEAWTPTAVRITLGLIFLWFGVAELLQPHMWTGYVPLLASGSSAALFLVLLHGGLLWMLATALILGIAPRTAALLSVGVMLEIILMLLVGHGLSDIVARDFGVLGLALVTLAGP